MNSVAEPEKNWDGSLGFVERNGMSSGTLQKWPGAAEARVFFPLGIRSTSLTLVSVGLQSD